VQFVDVRAKFTWKGETALTVCTVVHSLFHVNCHVTLYMTRLSEAPTTHCACVRLDTGMGQSMCLQMTDLYIKIQKLS